MDKFDIIIIGAGAGLRVASIAAKNDLQVALVDPGPAGGVCLNTGCTPSKILTRSADVVRAIEDAGAVGVKGEVVGKDFQKIMDRMRSFVEDRRARLEDAIKSLDRITWLRKTATFIGDKELNVGHKILTAPKMLIASGARAAIPPLPGLNEAGYLDHASLLELKRPPQSIIIIGAGYIGCEYGHFFSAMGTEVTILGRSPEVLNREDPEICRIIKGALSGYMNVLTGHEALEIRTGKAGDGIKKSVLARNLKDGRVYRFEADEIMVAAGRRSNADIIKPEKSGVMVDDHGWIKTDEHLQTTRSGIWAIGDALGRHMFRHTAKYEADIVSQNMIFAKSKEEMVKADYHAVPHAVSTYPAVAGVGLRESEALAAGYRVLVGRVHYTDMAMGYAMAEENGFIKSVVEVDTGRILGCSIVGSEASSLIQQVAYLMNANNQDISPMMRTEIIHPALSELVVRAFSKLGYPAVSMQQRCDIMDAKSTSNKKKNLKE